MLNRDPEGEETPTSQEPTKSESTTEGTQGPVQTSPGSTGIGGDVDGSVVITGSGNTVMIVKGEPPTAQSKTRRSFMKYLIPTGVVLLLIAGGYGLSHLPSLVSIQSTNPPASQVAAPIETTSPIAASLSSEQAEPPDPTKTPTEDLKAVIPGVPGAITLANADQVRQIQRIVIAQAQLAWSPDNRYLALLSGGINLYDAVTFEPGRVIGKGQRFDAFAFSADGKSLLTAAEEIILWAVDTGGQLKKLSGYDHVKGLSLSPDDTLLALWVGDVVKLIRLSDGSELATLSDGSMQCPPDFSPDGKHLAICGGTGGPNILVFDITDPGAPVKDLELKGHSNWIQKIEYSRDGSLLASASVDQTAMVWDTQTGLTISTLQGHTGQVDGVAISPDGTIGATVSWDKTVKLWDTHTGKELQSLTGHTNWGKMIDYSPDGTKIASGEFGSLVLIWGLPANK